MPLRGNVKPVHLLSLHVHHSNEESQRPRYSSDTNSSAKQLVIFTHPNKQKKNLSKLYATLICPAFLFMYGPPTPISSIL